MLRELPWPFREKVRGSSEPTGLRGLGGKLTGKRRALGDRFRGLTWDKMPLPTAPQYASL